MDIRKIAATLIASDSTKAIDDAVEELWQNETEEWKSGLQWGLDSGPESPKMFDSAVEKALGREMTDDEQDYARSRYDTVTDREFVGTYKKVPRFSPEEEKMMEADRQIDRQKDGYPEND